MTEEERMQAAENRADAELLRADPTYARSLGIPSVIVTVDRPITLKDGSTRWVPQEGDEHSYVSPLERWFWGPLFDLWDWITGLRR